jgi:hypothetical protein
MEPKASLEELSNMSGLGGDKHDDADVTVREIADI